MLNLLIPQLFNMLKANGFDPEKAQAGIAQAVGDIRAMKESQDRCERMLRDLCEANGPDEHVGIFDPPKPSQNITVTKTVLLGKAAP